MCYDIKASLEAQLKRAKRYNNVAAILEIEQKLLPYLDVPLHHASGFSHPKVLVYPSQNPEMPLIAQWGLVPHWVRSQEQKSKLWNSTINARLETLLEKPSFRDAAQDKRCLIYVDGFFEHHHDQGKTYPFYVSSEDGEPLCLAAIWSEWASPETGEIITSFAIVTTKGNAMMAKIHNNPKLKEPRMPLILKDEQQAMRWLQTGSTQPELLNDILASLKNIPLKAHTVERLRGKAYIGNVPEVTEVYEYPELNLTL
ncbi:MAG: SOS response-associated peptidase [Gilvibacter sp.]